MASSKEYLDFILEQVSELDNVSYKAMMGEFIIYYKGKIIGGIYDDRLLVKPVQSAINYMPNAVYELPYDGAKEMLLVDEVDNKEFLIGLFDAVYDDLPAQNKLVKVMTLMPPATPDWSRGIPDMITIDITEHGMCTTHSFNAETGKYLGKTTQVLYE